MATSSRLNPADFVGRPCNHDPRVRGAGSIFYTPHCDNKAVWLIKNGDVPVLSCDRHLVDSLDEVVIECDLDVHGLGVEVFSLKEMRY